MAEKPTYEELEQRVKELEVETVNQKQAKNALHQYKHIVASSSDMLAILDMQFKYLEANESYIEAFNLTIEQLIGSTVTNVFGDEFFTSVIKPYADRCLGGEEVNYQDWFDFPTHGRRYMDITYYPYYSEANNVLGFVVNGRNITERKLAEDALLERTHEIEERIKELNCLYSISQIWERAGFSFEVMIQEIVELLPNSWQYPEITCSQVIIDDIEFRTKNFKKTKWKLSSTIIAYGEKMGTLEIYYLEEKPKSDEGPFLNEERNLINAISEQLARIIENERIEKTLHENENKDRLKMESIDTLTGCITHEFNNVLYMIIGNTELALEDIPEWNPIYANLREIKSAVLRATGIVKQLINFNRQADQALKPIDTVIVIKDFLKSLRSTIPPSIEIRKNLPETEVMILGDPTQINHVMMNLCINATQEMEETGGILEISVDTVTLDEHAADAYLDLNIGDYVKVTVRDTGSGIEPEIIDRIFDPYFTTKAVGKGSGMGLSVVRGIVKRHSGAITVDSEIGEGTTFTILFPVTTEKLEVETETIFEPSLGTEAILFIDDEKSIVDMTGQVLERLGYKVETRLNPAEALELFQSSPERFDIVITDMTMPQMTGVKLSDKLKEIRPDIPVILCTGHRSLISEEKAKEMGIDGYVMKPIMMRKLGKTIREVLDKGQEK